MILTKVDRSSSDLNCHKLFQSVVRSPPPLDYIVITFQLWYTAMPASIIILANKPAFTTRFGDRFVKMNLYGGMIETASKCVWKPIWH